MSHKDKKCLKVQAQKRFRSITCLGRSKYEDKKRAADEYDRLPDSAKKNITKRDYINDAIRDHIYSYKTYENYEKHNNYFLAWIEATHPECKTLDQAYRYADDWLKLRVDQGLSSYTLQLERSALCKLYGVSADAFSVTLPQHRRSDITRSRGIKKRDYGFSLKKHEEIIDFCRGTGLRRSELSSLCVDQLGQYIDGSYYLMIKGKGGKVREAPIIGPHVDRIVSRIESADGLVWDHIPSHMDVHSYRSDYATAIYKAYERDEIPREDRYYFRGDRKGEYLDKKAMMIASQALGHDRISVVGTHYIR